MIQAMEAQRIELDDLKLEKPLLLQPKLNGIRALWDPEKKALFTKSGYSITSVPHIVEAILSSDFANFPLDGELFKRTFPFQKINGLAQREKPNPESLQLEFHCFDLVLPRPCLQRIAVLDRLDIPLWPMKVVPTYIVTTIQEIGDLYALYLSEGYEGIILRDPDALYHAGRGPWLMKVKPEREMEAKLVGLNPAAPGSKNEDTFGSLQLETSEGKTFKCAGLSAHDRRLILQEMPLGKPITVTYTDLSTRGIPLTPRFKAVRWDHIQQGDICSQ